MENLSKEGSPVVSPRANNSGGATMMSPHAGRDVVVAETITTEAMASRGGSVVVGGSEGEERGEEEVVVDDVGGVDGDLGGCLGDNRGGDGGAGGGSGVGSGSGVGGRPVEEGVVEEVVEVLLEGVLVVEVVEQGGERVVGGGGSSGGGGNEGVMEEGDDDEGMVEEIMVVEMRSGEPKGKGISTGEPVISQGPVITPLDFAESARQEDVMKRAREDPGVLDIVITAMREARKAETAHARAIEERDAEAWA